MDTDNSLPTEGDPRLPTDAAASIDPGTSHHSFGDQHDDDGPAIDQYLQAAPDAPIADQMITYGVATTPMTTRLLTRVMTLDPTGGAIQVFPADPSRERLLVRVITAASYAFVHSDPVPPITTASTGGGYYGIVDADGGIYDLSGHTGPVYLSCASAAAVVVSVIVVTV
jgi:hypothetical protein